MRYNNIADRNEALIVTTSWDDGQRIDIHLARLLAKYNIKGTFYITKSYRDPLTESEIKEIDSIYEIGAHTLNHVDLSRESFSTAIFEINASKKYIENIIGHNINMFCYPYGRFNEGVKNIVRDAGFIGGRTCDHQHNVLHADPFEWGITLHASNGSPLTTFRICVINRLSIRSLIDWEIRAKELFDHFLGSGGIYHLWGHASEFEERDEWDKLERLLEYISNRDGVRYMANGEILDKGYY